MADCNVVRQHKQVLIQVWAYVDEGIAELVEYLNSIPGITTHASCQGSIGEGGALPYDPYVMASWAIENEELLFSQFKVTPHGGNWGSISPPKDWVRPAHPSTPAEHHYISTACLHGRHTECRKQCKFCSANCACKECEHSPMIPSSDGQANS